MQHSVIRGREEVLWEARTAGLQPDVGWGKGRAKPSPPVGCCRVIGWTVVRRQRERINPCKDVDVQESSQLGTVGRAWSVWGRGKRVLEGPTEDGIPGTFKQASSLQSSYF